MRSVEGTTVTRMDAHEPRRRSSSDVWRSRAVVVMVLGWLEAGGFMQAMGATETILLIYGVAGLPIAILVGVSYALWAGLCVAFLAYGAAPAPVRDRLGLMDRDQRGV